MTWLVTFDGIGPIEIGGSLSDPVTGALTEEFYGDAERCRYFTGREIDPVVISRGTVPDVIGGVYLPAKDSATGYPRTPEGIGTGMTTSELLVAYPDAVASGRGAPPSYVITNQEDRYIHFTITAENIIDGIYLEETPALSWEYCD